MIILKIKKLIDICKKTGNIFLYDTGNSRWISDGHAIYDITELPAFDEFTLCKTYDINDKQASKINFRNETMLPQEICFTDICENETIAERGPMWLSHAGTGIIPFKTSQGVVFVESKYLQPLSDVSESLLTLYERTTKNGNIYFAVKSGMLLLAVITPFDVVNEEFVERLKELTQQCEVALFNKKSGDKANVEGQMSLSAGEEKEGGGA